MKCGTASAALAVLFTSYPRFPATIDFIYRAPRSTVPGLAYLEARHARDPAMDARDLAGDPAPLFGREPALQGRAEIGWHLPPPWGLHLCEARGSGDLQGRLASGLSRYPVNRPRMMCSASAMMRSISSFTVGTSWMRPTTMPQLQAPASMSPSSMTLG
jgi:hypothetical protein